MLLLDQTTDILILNAGYVFNIVDSMLLGAIFFYLYGKVKNRKASVVS